MVSPVKKNFIWCWVWNFCYFNSPFCRARGHLIIFVLLFTTLASVCAYRRFVSTCIVSFLKSTNSVPDKEICNGGVACSLLKLGSLEKNIVASTFHSGLHSSSPFFVEKTTLHDLLPS